VASAWRNSCGVGFAADYWLSGLIRALREADNRRARIAGRVAAAAFGELRLLCSADEGTAAAVGYNRCRFIEKQQG
jgi:hypothetical protein